VLAAHRRAAATAGHHWKPLSSSKSEPKGASRSFEPQTDVRFGGREPGEFVSLSPGPPKPDRDLELRDAIQRIALEFPSYGWPRMTEELRQRGWAVNHKRVYLLMRENNLLCLRQRKFVVTTDYRPPRADPDRSASWPRPGWDRSAGHDRCWSLSTWP
jgi:transposase InsO family protein